MNKKRFQVIELNYAWADYNDPCFKSERTDNINEVLPIYHERKHKLTYGKVYLYDHVEQKAVFTREIN